MHVKHLLFYDTECPFCQKWALRVASWDKKKIFGFAGLKGKTAKKYLLFEPRSLVLLENYENLQKVVTKSKAIFRIFWLLGGKRKVLGVFYFIPSFFFDWFYHFVALNRSKGKKGELPPRFFP